jgi:predicted RNase H-like HicB family nuclease
LVEQPQSWIAIPRARIARVASLLVRPTCHTILGMRLHAVLISAPEGGYVAFNPETGTTTQGETVEEAIANLKEATELYLEECPPSEDELEGSARPAMLATFEAELA